MCASAIGHSRFPGEWLPVDPDRELFLQVLADTVARFRWIYHERSYRLQTPLLYRFFNLAQLRVASSQHTCMEFSVCLVRPQDVRHAGQQVTELRIRPFHDLNPICSLYSEVDHLLAPLKE